MGQEKYSEKWLGGVIRDIDSLAYTERGLKETIKDLAEEILDLRQQLQEASATRPDHLSEEVVEAMLKAVKEGRCEALFTFKFIPR